MNLFADVKTRTVIILTGIILLAMIVWGIARLRENQSNQAPSSASKAPNITSIPGKKKLSSREYENVNITNEQRQQQAQQTGDSAIDTFIPEQTDTKPDLSLLSGQSSDNMSIDSSNDAANSANKNKTTAELTAEQVAALEAQQQQQQQKFAADQAAANAEATARQQALQQALSEAKQKQQVLTEDMQTQAKAIMASWAGAQGTPRQQYISGKLDTEDAGQGKLTQAGSSPSNRQIAQQNQNQGQNQAQNQTKAKEVATVKAGEVSFAILNTEVNSDQPGPILATIVSGPLRGAKLIGAIEQAQQIQGTNGPENVILTFKTMSSPELPTSLNVSAVAIDADTARTALSSEVDHHYLYRYGTVFASAFLSGYGSAITSSGTTTFNDASGGSTTIAQQLSPKEQFLAGLGNVGTQLGSQLNGAINRPNTIIVNSGTTLGILFLNDVIIK